MKHKKKKKKYRVFWFFAKLQFLLMLIVVAGVGYYYYGGYAVQVQKMKSEAAQFVHNSTADTFCAADRKSVV